MGVHFQPVTPRRSQLITGVRYSEDDAHKEKGKEKSPGKLRDILAKKCKVDHALSSNYGDKDSLQYVHL